MGSLMVDSMVWSRDENKVTVTWVQKARWNVVGEGVGKGGRGQTMQEHLEAIIYLFIQ